MEENKLSVINNENNLAYFVSRNDLLEFAEVIINKVSNNTERLLDMMQEEIYEILNNQEELLTVNEVAKVLRVTKQCLWKWEKSKKLVPARIGSSVRYLKSEVNELIKNRGI